MPVKSDDRARAIEAELAALENTLERRYGVKFEPSDRNSEGKVADLVRGIR
jgi:hypothetical protein